MTYITALFAILIIVLTSIIIFKLYQENRFIKEATKKEISNVTEGFEGVVAGINNSTDKTEFPLREFIIQSSYNSAIKDNKASKEQLTELINRGTRVFDFEIYARDNDLYVSYSEDKEYKRLETELDLTVDAAFSHLASKAFMQAGSGPLFVHLRVKTPSAKTFQQLATSIQDSFGTRLLPAGKEVNGSTYFKDLLDKVVIIHDQTSGNRPSNHPCVGEKCVQYVDLVNIYSGTVDMPLYTQIEYTDSMGLTKKVSVEPETGRTDIDTFYMVMPSAFEKRCGNRKSCGLPPLMETMKTKPCQMMLMQEDDPEMDAYQNIFVSAGSSYCLVSKYLDSMNEKNVET